MAPLKTFMLCVQSEKRGRTSNLHKIASYSASVASRKGDAGKNRSPRNSQSKAPYKVTKLKEQVGKLVSKCPTSVLLPCNCSQGTLRLLSEKKFAELISSLCTSSPLFHQTAETSSFTGCISFQSIEAKS